MMNLKHTIPDMSTYEVVLRLFQAMILFTGINMAISDFFEGPLVMWMHKEDLSKPPENFTYYPEASMAHASVWVIFFLTFILL